MLEKLSKLARGATVVVGAASLGAPMVVAPVSTKTATVSTSAAPLRRLTRNSRPRSLSTMDEGRIGGYAVSFPLDFVC
jgi:hypothetical protein